MDNNILLINPAINPASQNKIVNDIVVALLPTSLGVLAGYLDEAGVSPVHIIDEQVDFIWDKDLPSLISSLQSPKIIGISALTINSKRAYELADKIKEVDPNTFVVLGGIHPTVVPEEALKHPGVDVVVRGEGEKTFAELIEHIFNQKDYSQIYGISLRRNGTIIHNPDRPLILNLDEIPPFPYHLFERNLDSYTSFNVVFTSRGCPYNCRFCSSRNISGRRYRYFSVNRILSEIKLLSEKYGQKSIWMVDDNLAANRKRFMELLDAIIKADLHKKVEFHGSIRGDNINEEILERAKEANFKMLSFGLETANEALMELIDKGETVKQVRDAIIKTDKKGIVTAATLIFGLPGETRRDRWDAIKLVHSLPLSSVRFNTLTPYPGTPLFEELNNKGKLFIKKDWENFAVQYMWEGDGLPYVPDGNNRYELLFDTMYANLSFYLNFRGMRRMIKSSVAGGNVINLKKKWYLSLKIIWRFLRLFLYLVRRFLYVTYKMVLEKL